MRKLLLIITSFCFVIILQAQVYKTINVVKAGTLSTLLTGTDMSLVTNLTVTGSIDSLDFVTIHNLVYNSYILNVLDLSGTNSTIIPTYAFEQCNNLTSVSIPSSVTSIGSNAFFNCNNLTSVTISSSVTSIGIDAFIDCSGPINVDSNNPNYSSIAGVLFNKMKTTLIHCPVSMQDSYIIPTTVDSIGIDAFGGCSNLLSVTIPSSVTSIGSGAFSDCSSLTSVTIPSSVISIGIAAFMYCSGLINVDSNNPNYSSLAGVLFNKSKTTLIQHPDSLHG